MSRLPLENLDPEPELPGLEVERPAVHHAPWDAEFAARVYRRRKYWYRSAEAAEIGTGIPARTWERIESGESEPRGGTLKLICEKLKTNPVWLLWGVGDPELPDIHGGSRAEGEYRSNQRA